MAYPDSAAYHHHEAPGIVNCHHTTILLPPYSCFYNTTIPLYCTCLYCTCLLCNLHCTAPGYVSRAMSFQAEGERPELPGVWVPLQSDGGPTVLPMCRAAPLLPAQLATICASAHCLENIAAPEPLPEPPPLLAPTLWLPPSLLTAQ